LVCAYPFYKINKDGSNEKGKIGDIQGNANDARATMELEDNKADAS
jgi:hypothetical protein